jgi:hypothetical protein
MLALYMSMKEDGCHVLGWMVHRGQVLVDLQKKSLRMMEMWEPKGEGKADQPKSPRRSMQLQKHQQGVLIQRKW